MVRREGYVHELGFQRDDLDDAGLAHRSRLGVILMHERKLPQVGQGVADSVKSQEVLTCSSQIIGTLYFLLRSQTSLTADTQDPVRTWVLPHLEENADPRVSQDIA